MTRRGSDSRSSSCGNTTETVIQQIFTSRNLRYHIMHAEVYISMVMDYLAMETMADQGIAIKLKMSNADLMEAVRGFTWQLGVTMSTMQPLTKVTGERKVTNKSGQEEINMSRKRFPFEVNGYWWSCGFKVQKGYSSENFRRKKSGHELNETRANQMEGNQYNKYWKPYLPLFGVNILTGSKLDKL